MTRTKKRRTEETPVPASTPSRAGGKAGAWFLAAIVAGGVALLIALNTLTGSSDPDFGRLKGQWRRRGEQYVLDIRGVAADGRVDAAYFNPRPINVAQARAKWEGGATHLFVELRDRGYDGSTYELTYDPHGDELTGRYSPSGSEPFDVIFEREQP